MVYGASQGSGGYTKQLTIFIVEIKIYFKRSTQNDNY